MLGPIEPCCWHCAAFWSDSFCFLCLNCKKHSFCSATDLVRRQRPELDVNKCIQVVCVCVCLYSSVHLKKSCSNFLHCWWRREYTHGEQMGRWSLVYFHLTHTVHTFTLFYLFIRNRNRKIVLPTEFSMFQCSWFLLTRFTTERWFGNRSNSLLKVNTTHPHTVQYIH